MKTYFIEHTDTFGGEANYAWVRRYLVRAKTKRGALRRIASGWRSVGCDRYDSVSGATCWFVEFVDAADISRLEAQYSSIERV